MNKKIENRKCVVCGKLFTPKAVNAKCCSDVCRKKMKAKNKKKASKSKSGNVVKAKCVERINIKKPVAKNGNKSTSTNTTASKPSIVEIKQGDTVRFINFSPSRIVSFAMKLMSVAMNNFAEEYSK